VNSSPRPASLFYAPVTLSPVAGVKDLQFAIQYTVTNAGPNPGPAVAPGRWVFSPSWRSPFRTVRRCSRAIPPAMFLGLVLEFLPEQLTNQFLVTDFIR